MSYLQVGHTELPLPNSSANIMQINVKSIWLRTTKFCTWMSSYVNYLINTSVCFKIRNISGQTVLTLPAAADGRMQNVWSLPDRWLHLERTALEGIT